MVMVKIDSVEGTEVDFPALRLDRSMGLDTF